MSIAQTPQAASWRRLLRRVWPWRRWLLGGVLALLLLPYVALCLYSQPYWDDYDYAALARRVGQWPAQRYLYTHFTGRYFTLLLTRLNPLAYGWLPGFKWLSLGWLSATLVVQTLALRVLARQRLSWRAAAGWSGALILAQLYVMPSPYGAFYWFSSAVVYQVPVILAMLFPVAALQAGRASHFAGRAGCYTIAALALLGMVGSNELALLLAVWFLGWCCWLSYRRASYPALRRWLGLAVVALAGALVVVLAPAMLSAYSTKTLAWLFRSIRLPAGPLRKHCFSSPSPGNLRRCSCCPYCWPIRRIATGTCAPPACGYRQARACCLYSGA
ncbi:hypothetical protein [Hymenobacter sp. BRD67]|uniref:hypothetical protein n=1 Tax=Hymenobacter sp. BRD67 TaxID=2675877 RepID=UPI0015665AA4|nr:hypothetical protein [Hymenobacter sp. BRD67]QKG52786.1 hypothetical protein GKZ67_09465 [Hymenobacter sp. BRD67]